MNALTIVRCQVGDAAMVAELARKTFTQSFAQYNTPENLDHYLRNALSDSRIEEESLTEGSEFYFAYVDDDLVGYFKVNHAGAQSDRNEPGTLELERIYIEQSFQNRGYGFDLLNRAIELATQSGLKSMWLGVWDQNQGAIRFYERHGFVHTGEHSFMLGDEKQTDFIMHLSLAESGADS